MSNKTIISAEPNKQELFIIREFDAPRELVYKAFTERELITQWLSPCTLKMSIDTYENKSHGAWRFIHTDEAGNEYAFNGTIHEVCPPERIVRTFEFEGLPMKGEVSLEFATFEALPNNRSKLTVQAIYKSVASRDGHVNSGMEHGVVDSHHALDELLATLKK
ncbi:SRPBCC family protein [Mariniflexile litorale]|uniref:SRPBCC family protein n=1 Tax=Mariniflexile litorale TaxID=3045158 RepID=A0AAU7EH76_9FLAO|nr:SRPBCC family protein [Mariniflexile sp. KMM 9835]MDQ8212031.1 SRPBCC family protein [Mariniflexile sp. KMM 9835]